MRVDSWFGGAEWNGVVDLVPTVKSNPLDAERDRNGMLGALSGSGYNRYPNLTNFETGLTS